MTVEKGANRLYIPGLTQFIGTQPHSYLSVALIPSWAGQMKGYLQRLCNALVRDQQKPMFLDNSMPTIPTTNEKGRIYVEYNVATQNYDLTLIYNNYIVMQTIPEHAYV